MGLFDHRLPPADAGKSPAKATSGSGLFAHRIPAAPVKPEEPEQGWGEWAGNAAYNLVEGAGDAVAAGAIGAVDRVPALLGNIVQGSGRLIEGAGDALERGLPISDRSDDEIAADQTLQATTDKVGGWIRSFKPEKDRQPNISMDQLWEAPLSRAVPFAIEQGLASLPDMVAAVAALPLYIAGRTNELGEARAVNNGGKAEDVTFGDLMKAAPAAVASALLEKIGAKSVFGLDDAVGGILARGGKSAVKEGATEGAQEGIEYLGEQAGTNKGVTWSEAGKRMATGALAGGIFGGAMGAGVAAAEGKTGRAGGIDDMLPAGAGRAEDVLEDVVPVDRERLDSTRLTEGDRASPIPNDLIDDGKAVIEGAKAGRGLGAALAQGGAFDRFDIDVQDATTDEVNARQRFDGDIQSAAAADGQFYDEIQRATAAEADMAGIDFTEIEDRIRQDVEEDSLQSEGPRPSFLDQFSPAEANAYAQAPGVNRAIARRLGVKIDEMEARGDMDRAGRLRAKLGPILESFGAGPTSPSTPAAPPASYEAPGRAPSSAPAFRRSTGLMPSGDGSRRAPVVISGAADLDGIAPRIAAPTEGQAEAGNYRKGHASWQGLQLAIETPKGGKRTGVDASGSTWVVSMPAHYGDIKGTKGADGDPVDVYVGEDPTSDTVFIVDQKDAETGAFDEHKVFIGTKDEAEVAGIYEGAFSDGRGGSRLQDISETTVEGLKDWLANGDTSKPFGASAVRAQRATLAKKPVTTMLRKAGGIDPQSALAGNLRSMGITAKTAPGLFRNGGRGAADNFVRAEHPLFEAGPDDGNGYIPEAEILEALRREMAGDPLRTAEEAERAQAAKPDATEDQSQLSRPDRNKRSRFVTDPVTEVDRMIDVYGYPDSPELRSMAASLIQRGVDPEDAMVAATERLMSEGLEPNEAAAIDDAIGIPFFGEVDGEAVGTDVPGAEDAGRGEPGPRGEADGATADGRGDRPAGERAPTEEVGADGKPQLVIPGAEAVRDRNPAQRLADQKMRSNKPQTGMDVGMFGTGVDQIDLLDMPAAKPKAVKQDVKPDPVDDFDAMFDAGQDEADAKAAERSKAETAKSAAKNLAESANDAMAALSALFNSQARPGSGPTFDAETYAKAKPLFASAAKKFVAAGRDTGRLVQMIVVDMRENFGLTREGMEAMRPYLRRFMADVERGDIDLDVAKADPVAEAAPAVAKTADPVDAKPGSKLTGTAKSLAVGEREFPNGIAVDIQELPAAGKNPMWSAKFLHDGELLTDVGSMAGGTYEQFLDVQVGPYVDSLVARQLDLQAERETGWPASEDTKGANGPYKLSELAIDAANAARETIGAAYANTVGADAALHRPYKDALKAELTKRMDDAKALVQPKKADKPAPKAKEAKPPRELRTDWGVEDIDGWTEIEGGANTPSDSGLRGGVKDAFLLDAKNYLNDVAKRLQAKGFTTHVDKKGKADKAVRVNEAGPAVSGEVSLTMNHPESGGGIYVQIDHAGGLRTMYRSANAEDKFGSRTRSGNRFIDEPLDAQEFADLLEKTGTGYVGTKAATKGVTDGKPEPLANDGVRPPEGTPADAVRGAEVEGPRGRVAGSAREGSAPAVGASAGGRDERGGSLGDRTGTPAADAGTGSGAGREDGPRNADGDARRPDRAVGRGRADFRITAPEEIGAGGQKTKFDNNLRAIEILDELAGTTPTEDQKRELARYVGWGGIPQAFKKPDGTYAEGWENRAKKLEAILSKDALAAARRSTQDAHYTSPEIVSAMWRAAQRLGFKSGRVLEPSVGVGNFLGLRPDGVNARFTAVEYDDTTAAIAKALYGASDVHHQGFQDFNAPDGYFDLAIGNPPFGSQKLFDPKREHLNNFSIHNMFFAKSVDLLRSDGVLAMVVSNSFLDAVVKDKARKYIAAKTQFLGAIRLPNNAFAKNAGTEVTTDIIFLRKLKDGEAVTGETWTDTAYVPDPLGGEDMPLNEYFVRNPDMMLGTFQRAGSMYRAGATALIAEEGADISTKLDAAIAKLPRDVMGDWTNDVVERSRAAQVDKSVKVGSMFIDERGDVAVRGENFGTNSRVESAGLTGKSLDRAKGMIQVRDILTDLRGLQLDENSTDAAIETQRGKLNAAYDAFVKANGPISTDANRRVFGEDPTWPQLAALEDGFDKGISATVAQRTGETPRAPTAKKAAIFSKRTQAPYKPPTTAANAKDALTAALSIAGRVDMDLMSRLTNRSEASLFDELSGLVFKTPEGTIVTREEYLSGNVKAKLATARLAAKTDSSLAGNVTALEAVQPMDIEAADIDVKPGAHWMPANYVADFINHITGAGGATATYSRLTGQWSVRLGQVAQTAEVQYGTDRADIGATLRAALEQRAVQVYDQVDRDTRVLNQEASEAATEKSRRIADEWRRWIWSDDARRRDLAALYNEQFNTTIPRDYDGSHLTFPGKIGDDILKLRPHQANAVWRMVQGGTTLLDHVVGAGKTFTMVAGAMELRRTGFARKPMFVVPNHLVGQWAEDFMRLYPGARVLAATKKDFEKNNRKRLFNRIATGDWDAVIIAHSSFGKVELDAEFMKEMLDEQLADIEEAIGDMKRAAKDDRGDDRTVKQAEKQREALKERLERLSQSGAKDDNLTFGELGVDALFLDEAHEFKNLAFVTKQRGVMGLGNPLGSQKAMDMFLKTQFILRKNGGRNVVHATGTPISNTMAEMYTVGRYLDYDDMRARGVIHFDAWARQFGEVVTDWEISPSGKYKLTARFAKFVNMPELMQRYATFADVINRDDINRQLALQGKKLPIPKIKGGKPQNIIVPRSNDQAQFIGIPSKDAEGNDTENYPQGSLVWRTENMPKRPEKGADNMLKIMGDARKAALDMRLIDPSYPDNPGSKINEAAGRIRTMYDKWNAQKGVQLVFIDLSTPKAAKGKEAARIRALIDAAEGSDMEKAEAAQAELDKMSPDEIDALSGDFSVYDDLKQKLIARGIPEAEIAFIHDAGTEIQKDELFGRVRSGRVRVLFGSTAKMGAGMNVQNLLVGLHHMDAPWRPSDLEQREGRIIRQGNELYAADPEGFEIEINRYATERTLDARMWQTIEAKARFIEQVRKGVGGREIEDVGGEAANAAEMKAAASGNPEILEEMNLRKVIRTLENQRREHMREITRAADSIDRMRTSNERMKRDVPLYRADAEVDTKTFAATVGKKSFDKMGEAADAIAKEVRKQFEAGEKKGRVGTLFGIPLRFDVVWEKPVVSIESLIPHEATLGEGDSPIGVVIKLRNGLNNSATNADAYEAQIAEQEKEIAKLEARGAPAWPKDAEFDAAKAKHEALLVKLRPKAKPKPAAPVEADAQAEAPLGWGTVGGVEDKPRMSEEEQAEVTAIIRRVSGLSEVKFRETIQVPTTHASFKSWGREGKEGETVGIAGYYTPSKDAIVIALDANMGGSRLAYHESFHRLQAQFLTDQEKALLAGETERLRALVAKTMGREKQAAGMSQSELEAEAFAIYSEMMDARRPAPFTIKARIRSAWDRIRDMVTRVRNYLNGRGYQTLEDVFDRARSGETAARGADGRFARVDPSFSIDEERTTTTTTSDVTTDRGRFTTTTALTEGPPERKTAGFLAKGQPLDRALRIPFDIFGGTDANGEWKPGKYLTKQAAKIITEAKFSPDGRMAWMNGALSTARAGLIDRYGLDAAYVERDQGRALDERAIMFEGVEILKSLADQNVSVQEAKVLQAILTGEDVNDADMAKLAEPIRVAIDELGQEAVQLGLLSAESYERNRGAYLHRVYLKHEADQSGLTKMVGKIMGSSRQKIIGDQFKGRGMFFEVPREAATRNLAEVVKQRREEALAKTLKDKLDRLANRRKVAAARLEESQSETAVNLARRMDLADAAREQKGGARPYQKGQMREQGVAMNRLRKKAEQANRILSKIDAEADAITVKLDGIEANSLIVGKFMPVKGEKYTVLVKRAVVDGKSRVVNRVYIPTRQSTPAAYSEYESQGTWEVRGAKGDKVILWRDYTKDERGKMGEILDARYTIGKTYLMMAHDLATGRFYRDIAGNPEWATKDEPIGASWKEAADIKRYAPDGELQWVRVPDTSIGGTGGKKRWGALAGQFVRAEIWRDLNEIEVMNQPTVWRMLLSQWKLNKTARSPVTHMNNVMSNLMFMDMADVRMQDLVAGVRAYATGSKDYDEAAKHGAFGVDMMAQEIRKNFLQPILDDIAKAEQDGTENSFLARAGFFGKLADQIWTVAKAADAKMIDAYRVEDEVFRMATYMRRRSQGDDARTAARVARETFMDYDIRAPWVNMARNSVLPFASYTYRAAPMIAKSIASRPWKLAKYVAIAYALNALAYAFDDEGDEERERASLRDEEQGKTWLGTFRMMRMPWRNDDGLPVFLDVRRWMPAGDIFDTNQGSAAIPIPSPLMFGGPLLMGFEIMLNKQGFTGEEISNDQIDTTAERVAKVGDYLWKGWMPSAAWIPGSWYWDKLKNAAAGATDGTGRPYDLPSALASSVGIKLKPQDVESGLGWQFKDMKKVETELRAEAKRLARQRERNLISQSAFDAGMATYMEKIGRLAKDAADLQKASSR